ncbi:hypothetical protein CXB51_007397 [Gossypium anomalum]|uniref:Uncharacterized protein n=1 Tax=Gossypium anomalum TaxID=47600 RepID=A0A8J5ZEE8_9ROSI|nr:hypothetical protein CXB51_007397 [Gossypium anomalum]
MKSNRRGLILKILQRSFRVMTQFSTVMIHAKNSYSKSIAFVHSFVHQLAYFFGYNVFDLKHTFKLLGLLSGLEKIAQTLNVAHIAKSSHQARSDNLLTLQCFMKLKSKNVFKSKWNKTNQMLLTLLALYGLIVMKLLKAAESAEEIGDNLCLKQLNVMFAGVELLYGRKRIPSDTVKEELKNTYHSTVFAINIDVVPQNNKGEILRIRTACLQGILYDIYTEFPGTIFKPSKQVIREDNPVINCQYMKSNVDVLQIIQLGLSLSDAWGNLLDFYSPISYIWEFNFRDFDINRDCYVSDLIELLKRRRIDFEKNKEKEIDSKNFAKNITWITFHDTYDFRFMLKILTQSPLPLHLDSFVHQLAYFFGYNIFDLKHTFKFLGLLGGLEKIAQTLNVARITGSSHQAGSDSLFTLQCFMKLKSENVSESKWNQMNQMLLPPLTLYGLVQTIG